MNKRKRFPKTGVLYAGQIPTASMVKIGDSLYNTRGEGYNAIVIRTRIANDRKPVLSQKKRKLENLKDFVLDKWRVGA